MYFSLWAALQGKLGKRYSVQPCLLVGEAVPTKVINTILMLDHRARCFLANSTGCFGKLGVLMQTSMQRLNGTMVGKTGDGR